MPSINSPTTTGRPTVSTPVATTQIRNIGDFETSVAVFPEGHPESSGIDEDIYYLKEKGWFNKENK